MVRLVRHPLTVVAAAVAAVVLTVLLLTGTSLYTEERASAHSRGTPGGEEFLAFSVETKPELRVFFVTIVGTDAAVDLLASQLEHFHALGIPYERMGVVLHVSPTKVDGTDSPPAAPYLDAARAIVARFPGVQSRLWHDKFVDNVKVTQLRLMLEQLGFTRRQLQKGARPVPGEPFDWVVYADSDELHQYVGLAPTAAVQRATDSTDGSLPRLLAFLTANDIGAIEGRFLDRVGEGGALVALDTVRPPFAQYPFGCDITGNIARGTPTKLMAWRPAMVKSGDGGFHQYDGSDPTNHLRRILGPNAGGWVHHFKWVSGIVEETRARLADFTARNVSYVNEVRLLAEYFDRNKNSVDVAPEADANCVRCSGPNGLVGPSDGIRYLTPLSDATIESAVTVISIRQATRPEGSRA